VKPSRYAPRGHETEAQRLPAVPSVLTVFPTPSQATPPIYPQQGASNAEAGAGSGVRGLGCAKALPLTPGLSALQISRAGRRKPGVRRCLVIAVLVSGYRWLGAEQHHKVYRTI